MYTRAKRTLPAAAVACLLLTTVIAAIGNGPAARADGTPDLALTKDAPGEILFGADATVSLTASNPSTETEVGYNLSFRDVLPAGTTYVPGSASIAPTTVLVDQPTPGATTLIWLNVADLTPASSFTVTYDVRHTGGSLGVGDTYVNQAGAYVNSDPRYVPDFDPVDGTPIAGPASYSGNAADSASTEIIAIEITKAEPNTEGEILRGLHDHQTVYTLTVQNNYVDPTDSIDVEDWLPAGLEYLACGTADNTVDAPTNPGSAEEYPAAGAINPGNAPAAPNCVIPDLVETVNTDPDGAGPLPPGVYTHVVWNDVADLASSASTTIQYVAAIPIRENTISWPQGEPTPAGLGQTANLDNNSGPETVDEQSLVNLAIASGQYLGALAVSDDHSIQRTAEDLSVHKGVSDDAINQGDVDTWSLLIETSEYRYVDNIRVTDTVPDGLCPLDSANLETPDFTADCDPSGATPSSPYTTATENVDGTWTLFWDSSTVPELARLQPSSSLTITFPTRTRTFYQQNRLNAAPVLAQDSWENRVDIAGADYAICAPNDPDCALGQPKIDADEADGGDDLDSSTAGQSASGPSIDKRVSQPGAVPLDCAAATYIDTVASSYGPGDRVCWQLRIDFPSLLDTGDAAVNDFLPPGSTYETGSMTPTGNNSVPIASFDDSVAGVLSWTLGSGTFTDPALVFEVRFATTFTDPAAAASGDILDNLMKFNHINTPGQAFPLRDLANFEWSEARLDLVKGVSTVDLDGNISTAGDQTTYSPPQDGLTVNGGNAVQYQLDIDNLGTRDADNIEVWDILPTVIDCTMVSAISDGGTCNNGGTPADPADDRIEWTGLVAAGSGTTNVTYWVDIPTTVAPGESLDNTAGVREYTSATNLGGDFPYIPSGNIDPNQEPSANTMPADDPSDVVIADATLAKTRTTVVPEGGNAGSNEATIGEQIDYQVTLTIPAGTTVYGPAVLDDPLGARQTYISGSLTGTLNGADPTASGLVLDDSGNTIRVTFPSPYTVPGPSDDVLVLDFSVTVDNDGSNFRGGSDLSNRADFDWQSSTSTAANVNDTVATTIVEPNLQLAKDENDADDVVDPGQIIRYALTLNNQDAPPPNVSTAHDLTIIDLIPVGLTPVDGVGTPVPDGGLVPPDNGTWDSGARTITWTLASLANDGTATFEYDVEVDSPAVGSSVFTNTAVVTGSSMAGMVTGERTSGPGYSDTAQDTVTVARPTNTKSVAPNSGTIGDDLVYTLVVSIPMDLTLFDGTVIDTLPDGIDFDGYLTAACTSGCPPVVTLSSLPAVDNPDGSTTLGWFFGDIAPAPTGRELTITFAAHIDDQYDPEGIPVQDSNPPLTNSVSTHWNTTDTIVGTPGTIPAGPFGGQTDPATADVDIIEPQLVLDKDVSGDPDDDDVRSAEAGESFIYTIVVENTGTSPAYDVTVTDQPDAELTNVALVDGAAWVVDGWSAVDPDIVWFIPGPIDPGPANAITLSYTADLIGSANLSEGQQVVNTADVPSYWGVPEGERTANGFDYVEYDNVADDTVTINVAFPALTIDKTTGMATFPDTGDAELLQPFPWQIVVTNTSAVAGAFDIDVTDVLPPNWTYDAGSAVVAPGGAIEPVVTPNVAGDILTWTDVADLVAGGTVTITFTATPQLGAETNPGVGVGNPNVNTANASGDDVSGAGGNADGPFETGDDDAQAILRVPALAVAKTPDGDPVVAGSPSQFQIVVNNTGDGTARNVVITDALPPGLTYTAGTATAAPPTGFSETSVTPGPGAGETTIVWSIADIAAAGSVTIVLPVTVDAPQPDGTVLVNTVSVASDEVTTPVTDVGSLTVSSAPVWAAASEKTSVPSDGTPVSPDDRIDYTIHYENTGNENGTGVVVEDSVPANSTYVAGSATSTPAASVEFRVAGTYQVAEPADPADVEALRWTVGDVDAGDSGDLGFSVTVNNPLPNGAVITNTATLVSDQTPGGTVLGPVSHPVTSAPVISLVKDVSATELDVNSAGNLLDYTLTLTNLGDEIATNVVVVDSPPAGTTLSAIDAGPFTAQCSTDGVTYGACPGDLTSVVSIEWSASALAPPDPVTFGITVAVTLPVADGTVIPNTATVITDQTGSTDSNPVETVIVSAPVIDLDKRVSPTGTVEPGDVLTYTLDWSSRGSLDATNVLVTDSIPADTTYVAASATGGAEFLVGGVYQATEPPDPADVAGLRWSNAVLAIGETRTASFEVLIDDVVDIGSTIDNTASVIADDLEALDDSTSNPVDSAPVLGITKTALSTTAAPGDEVMYQIEVTVDGNAPADPLRVTDTLPPRTTFVSATGGGVHSDGVVAWDLGARDPGFSDQFFVTIRLDGPFSDSEGLENTVIVAAPGTEDETDTVVVVIDAAAVVEITKTANASVVQVADQLTYTITVANSGDGVAENVVLTDTLPDELTFVSASPVAAQEDPLTWNLGDLEPGDSVTITVATTVIESGSFENVAVVDAINADADDDGATVTAEALQVPADPLPVTGIDARRILWLGIALVLLGSVLLIATRKTRIERK